MAHPLLTKAVLPTNHANLFAMVKSIKTNHQIRQQKS
jgi:hypothetical protein